MSGESRFVKFDLKVALLRSPTKQTLLGAVEQAGRHLDALMRFYAVKLLFIA
jgi:hypothetical protein